MPVELTFIAVRAKFLNILAYVLANIWHITVYLRNEFNALYDIAELYTIYRVSQLN